MIKDGSHVSTYAHEDIKSWAEAREARPVRVDNYKAQPVHKQVLFRFPEERYTGEEDLEWDEFFDIFDREQLEFHFEDIADDAMEQRNTYQFRPRQAK